VDQININNNYICFNNIGNMSYFSNSNFQNLSHFSSRGFRGQIFYQRVYDTR
jgi:hypothetical protein